MYCAKACWLGTRGVLGGRGTICAGLICLVAISVAFVLGMADLSDVCCDRACFAGADGNQMLIKGASMCDTFFRDLKGCPAGVGEGQSSIMANPNAS